MEVQGPDGAQMCSTALVIQPPAVAGADAAAAPAAAATSADSKKGGAKGKPASQDSKAAGAAAAKPRPGSSMKGAASKARAAADDAAAAAAAGMAGQQLQGGLQVLLQLPLSVAGRDYLRNGFEVKLLRTRQEPCAVELQPPAAAPASAAPAAGAAGKRVPSAKAATGASGKAGKAAAAAATTPDAAASPATVPVWRYETKQQLLGTVRLAAAELLECCGQQQASEGSVQFFPPAPLFSAATGTLLSLKEASHKLKPIGSCSYKLVLHAG
ncbi:hypothetical protein OEZ86_012155 [Tetradesmus obliquus]|nr:hypothetical protein OEZ86_012155 [Tetradesmus obliquus]